MKGKFLILKVIQSDDFNLGDNKRRISNHLIFVTKITLMPPAAIINLTAELRWHYELGTQLSITLMMLSLRPVLLVVFRTFAMYVPLSLPEISLHCTLLM